MYKNNFVFVFFVAIGLAASGSAIFAVPLGLDQNAGWGKARIEILFVGVLIILFAALYYLYADYINSAVYTVKAFFVNFSPQIFTVVIIVIVIIIYVWFATSGRWTTWKSDTYYYDSLAKGFLNGHLYLPVEPDQALLEFPDPYNYPARSQAGIEAPIDFSLYKGKFYIYWGPVPALILAVIYFVFNEKISDVILAFGFVSGIFLLQYALIRSIWKHYFSDMPGWLFQVSILTIGLVGPLTLLRHMNHSAQIYEAAISGAQFFFIAGMLVALTMIIKSLTSNWRFVSVGFFWALAIGSRLTTAAPIGFMVVLLFFWILKLNESSFKRATHLIFLSTPLVLGFLCLGWYNWARFGSITENGITYMLAGWNSRAHLDEFFSGVYIFQNIYNYLFNPPYYKPEFPFAFMGQGNRFPIFSFYVTPRTYRSEWMTGVLYAAPFAIFSIVPFFLNIIRRSIKKNVNYLPAPDGEVNLRLITIGLGGSFLIFFSILAFFLWASMRYTGDFMSSLMTLSIIGLWQGYRFFSPRPLAVKLYAATAIALICVSTLLGMLLLISLDSGLIHKLISFTSIKVTF